MSATTISCRFSRNIVKVTLEIIYFCYQKIYMCNWSIQKINNLILKKLHWPQWLASATYLSTLAMAQTMHVCPWPWNIFCGWEDMGCVLSSRSSRLCDDSVLELWEEGMREGMTGPYLWEHVMFEWVLARVRGGSGWGKRRLVEVFVISSVILDSSCYCYVSVLW